MDSRRSVRTVRTGPNVTARVCRFSVRWPRPGPSRAIPRTKARPIAYRMPIGAAAASAPPLAVSSGVVCSVRARRLPRSSSCCASLAMQSDAPAGTLPLTAVAGFRRRDARGRRRGRRVTCRCAQHERHGRSGEQHGAVLGEVGRRFPSLFGWGCAECHDRYFFSLSPPFSRRYVLSQVRSPPTARRRWRRRWP